MKKFKLVMSAFVVAMIIAIVILFSIYNFILLPKTAQTVVMADEPKVIEIINGTEHFDVIEIVDGTLSNGDSIENKNIVLSFVGDIYLSDYVLQKYNAEGVDGILSEGIRSKFLENDIVMANQEFAFSDRGEPMEDKQFTFRVNPKYATLFSEIDLDIVSLANNHTLDYGVTALKDSFDTLTKNGIMYVGAGNNIDEAKMAKHLELKNKKVAILSASRVIPVSDWNAYSSKAGMLTTYDPTILIGQIEKEKLDSDFVVVYVHWGIELEHFPEDYQKDLARKYIDAGADLVVGSHPHILQGIEYYNGKPIVYSLGNFMFYYNIDRTAVLDVTLTGDGEVLLQLIPCRASNAKTYIIEDEVEKQKFYDYMTSISNNVSFDENGFITNIN